MDNTLSTNNISIEKFAAFLDGNLPVEEMQHISAVIDGNEMYAEILGDVMHVDDAVEAIESQSDILPEELQYMDFDLPVIPLNPDIDNSVELIAVNADESDTAEIVADDEQTAEAILDAPTLEVDSSSLDDLAFSDDQETIEFEDFT